VETDVTCIHVVSDGSSSLTIKFELVDQPRFCPGYLCRIAWQRREPYDVPRSSSRASRLKKQSANISGRSPWRHRAQGIALILLDPAAMTDYRQQGDSALALGKVGVKSSPVPTVRPHAFRLTARPDDFAPMVRQARTKFAIFRCGPQM